MEDYKQLYDDAMAAANDAGIAFATAAEAIRILAAERDEALSPKRRQPAAERCPFTKEMFE